MSTKRLGQTGAHLCLADERDSNILRIRRALYIGRGTLAALEDISIKQIILNQQAGQTRYIVIGENQDR